MSEQLCLVDIYYTLLLNDMRSAKIEYRTEFGKFDTPESATAFYNGEKVEAYTDGHWTKQFRKGGALEWANAVWGPLELLNDGEPTGLLDYRLDEGIIRKMTFVRLVAQEELQGWRG